MAKADDDSAAETPSENTVNTSNNKKRRLRASPQSIREQSATAAAKAAEPHRPSIAGKILGAPFRLIGRIFRPVFRYLGRYKFFRVIGYILVPPYFRSAWRELRLVTWPNFRQTRDLTIAVIIFSIIFGVIVAAVDYVLDKLFRKFILNL